MKDWESDLNDDVSADAGDSTTETFDLLGLTGATRAFFRVEKL